VTATPFDEYRVCNALRQTRHNAAWTNDPDERGTPLKPTARPVWRARGLLPYGTCRVVVNRTDVLQRIYGAI
jgi:hypothetical protein